MKPGVRRAAGALFFCCATRLAAQTLPMPTLPSREAPETTGPVKGREWEYGLGAGVGWDSNLDFLIPNGPSDFVIAPRGGLARVFWRPQTQWRVSGAGGAIGHPEQRHLHRYNAEIDVEGTQHRSPNTDWRVNGAYGLGYGDSSRILLEQGVLLPLVARTRGVAAGFGVSHRSGPMRSLRVDARYYRTEFDTPLLIDGHSARVTLGLERKLHQRNTAAFEYSLEDVFADQVGRSYLTHFGSLQFSRVLSPWSALLVEAGASYTPDAARAGLEREANFFGGFSVSRRLRRSGLSLFLRREVTPAFGLGQSRVELRGGLGANMPLGHDFELRLIASHVQPETRRAGAGAYPSNDDAFVSLVRRIGQSVLVSGEARYRRRGKTDGLPLVQAFQASLFVSLETPSWKSIAPALAR